MYHLSLDNFDELNINKKDILALILAHSQIARRMRRNDDYYCGRHEILRRKKDSTLPNNQVVCNHAKDITDTATGYFMSNPITYSAKDDKDITPLVDTFVQANIDDVDADLAKDMSKFGVAYEYVYAKKDAAVPVSRNLSAKHCFIVTDTSIEENEVAGVYYYAERDDATQKVRYKATVVTDNLIYNMTIMGGEEDVQPPMEEPEQHYFGSVPIIEYQNNKEGIGDFEQEISLIDAYNTLMSDRVDDKDAFVDAILVVYGALMGDDEEETAEAMKSLQLKKLLELPPDAKAEYLTRQLDENGVEVLRNALKEDIYTFAHVPNLTDKNFAGNSSGIAMEYKLLGLEMITKTKERYYRRGLRKRIKLYSTYLNLIDLSLDAGAIQATFSRGLPKNLLELSQIVANLQNRVSEETLLKQLPFVEDVDHEIELVEEQKAADAEQQRSIFDVRPNTPPDSETMAE